MTDDATRAPYVAALPMYALPGTATAHETLWQALRGHIAAQAQAVGGLDPERLPAALSSGAPMALAQTPGLLLSQTCGYPYATRLRGAVRLVATPVYDAPGCEGALYRSAILVRVADPAADLADCAGYRPAINEAGSQSGHHALRAALAGAGCPAGHLGEALETGSHAASAAAVLAGRADVAALDCVTWALLQQAAPERMAGLRRIGWGPAAPGLPLVTALPEAVLTLRAALIATLHDGAAAAALARLRIKGIEILDDDDYGYLPRMAAAATEAGHPPMLRADDPPAVAQKS
ncbi:MAG: PhnD/SsuA/transferrin family substrate-binding protein [Pseudomonadota bacterium]